MIFSRMLAMSGTFDRGRYLAHRGSSISLGGLEKQNGTGNVSYDPDNHQLMTKFGPEKVERVADFIPPTNVFGDDDGGPYSRLGQHLRRIRLRLTERVSTARKFRMFTFGISIRYPVILKSVIKLFEGDRARIK